MLFLTNTVNLYAPFLTFFWDPHVLFRTFFNQSSAPLDTGVYAERLKELDEMREELAGLRAETPEESKKLRDDFSVLFTWHSTALEGNPLTLRETTMVMGGMTIAAKNLRDQFVAAGHQQAVTLLYDVMEKALPINEEILMMFHRAVMMDTPLESGVYRTGDIKNRGKKVHIDAPETIQAAMDDLFARADTESDVHPILRAVRFHLEFEGIHPFADGSGRTGRLLLNAQLMRAGYPPIVIRADRRKAYFDAFKAYFNQGNERPMLELVMDNLEESYLYCFRHLK